MDKFFIMSSRHRNNYVYSEKQHFFLFIPDKLMPYMEGIKGETTPNDYYARKYLFLKEHHFFEQQETKFHTTYTDEQVKKNLASLRHLLIEVTDLCNLQCKYCGYGEFYSNYDQRETGHQTFDNVKILLDYLVNLWCSDYNISFNNKINIGFYGGEPLLNMKLIQETIKYLENLSIENLTFDYNITTNGILLEHYMDFLVEKNFRLLISLDGNASHSSYRVDKQGNNSFERVKKNIQKLKDKYPNFFDKRVNFNTVLHNRNSVAECFKAIKELFNKVPQISELNTNGITPEKVSEFSQMFHSKIKSFATAKTDPDITEAFKQEDEQSILYHFMLINYVGNRYATYLDLFDSDYQDCYIPTGTCKPFERKLFFTVHGKILPCEKIGQKCVLASLKNGKLELESKSVAQYYSSLYKKIVESCSHCYMKRSCSHCLFLLNEENGRLICPEVQTQSKLQEEFSDFLTYAENNHEDYERLLSTITID